MVYFFNKFVYYKRMTRTGEGTAFSPSDSGDCPVTSFLASITKLPKDNHVSFLNGAGGEVLSWPRKRLGPWNLNIKGLIGFRGLSIITPLIRQSGQPNEFKINSYLFPA